LCRHGHKRMHASNPSQVNIFQESHAHFRLGRRPRDDVFVGDAPGNLHPAQAGNLLQDGRDRRPTPVNTLEQPMHTIYFDSKLGDDARRAQLYGGQLFVYSSTPSSRALIQLARDLIAESFGSRDPETAQHEMPVEEYVEMLAALKPRFIHHPDAEEHIRGILREVGCDLEKTYFDVPRLRTATSDGYLTSGIAYAFHPHRDTWYSAPSCQLNWWMPVYEIESGRSMAFHSRYWATAVRNSSRLYNYEEWNRTSRFKAAQHVRCDTRVQPQSEERIELDPQLRVLTPVGGILLFSAAHLHSTVPNSTGRTRFSIDFRTVHIDDVAAHRGAPNVDSACTGTTMNDYLRGTDLSRIPANLVATYDEAAAAIPR
jgi:hypothetical protein